MSRRFDIAVAEALAGGLLMPEDPDFVTEREMLTEKRPKPRPRVFTEPSRMGWWNTQEGNKVGQTFRGTLPDEGGEIGLLTVDTFGVPQHVTIALARTDDLPAAGTNADVIARITYGIGGMTDSFVCDWCNGVTLSIPAVTLRVSAIAVRGDPAAAYVARQVTLTAAVGRGDGVSLAPTRTILATLPAATAGVAPVPDFARTVELSGIEAGGATIYDANTALFFQDAAGNTIARYTGAQLAAGVRASVPGQAALFLIQNTAAAARTINVIFGLGL